MRALMLVVAGPPGAGKTTLARCLAEEMRIPLVSRDALKEGRVHTAGSRGEPGGPEDSDAYAAFFGTLEVFARHRISFVAEAAFQHAKWQAALSHLATLADVRVVRLNVSAEVAWRRRLARVAAEPERRRFHHEPESNASPPAYEAVQFDGPVLDVTTDEGLNPEFAAILDFARRAVHPAAG